MDWETYQTVSGILAHIPNSTVTTLIHIVSAALAALCFLFDSLFVSATTAISFTSVRRALFLLLADSNCTYKFHNSRGTQHWVGKVFYWPSKKKRRFLFALTPRKLFTISFNACECKFREWLLAPSSGIGFCLAKLVWYDYARANFHCIPRAIIKLLLTAARDCWLWVEAKAPPHHTTPRKEISHFGISQEFQFRILDSAQKNLSSRNRENSFCETIFFSSTWFL